MPIARARSLTSRERSPAADRALGLVLCLVAGSVNVSGLLLAGQVTSHMTGFVTAASARVAGGAWGPALLAAAAVAAFLAGAATCALLVRAGRHTRLHAEFAWPLGLEAAVLLALAGAGAPPGRVDAAVLVMLLCFAMGLQNALITKLSRAEIRTTHVTGIVTDLGIEAGRALATRLGLGAPEAPPAAGRGERARLLAGLLGAFFAGGVAGGWLAGAWGARAFAPPALLVAACAVVPIWDDVRAWRRRPTAS